MLSNPTTKSALDRRLRSLDRGLDADLSRDAEALHRARVASRRLREALPLLAMCDPWPEADREAFEAAGKTIRGLTRALGGVRELDVALAIVDEFSAGRPNLRAGLAAVRGAIADERERRLRGLRARVDVRRLRKTSRVLAGIAAREEGSPAVALDQRIRRHARALNAAVQQAGLVYAAETLHRIRIAAKKLRYALELVEEVEHRPARGLVRSLEQVQDLLGRMHDLEVVAAFARALRTDRRRPAGVRRALADVLDALDGEIRDRHADYVARHEALLALTADATALAALPARKRRSRRPSARKPGDVSDAA